MSTHDLAPLVTVFFVRHLPAERNASPHTIAAYRDTFKLLLRFVTETTKHATATLQVEDLTPDRILQFLTALETTRGNTIRTRNARLAAIHSFFRYVLDSDPALAAQSACARHSTEEGRASGPGLFDRHRPHSSTRADRSLNDDRRT